MSDASNPNDKPALALGDPPGRLARREHSARSTRIVLGLQVLLLILILLQLALGRWERGATARRLDRMEAGVTAAEKKQTAIVLEDRSLSLQAAEAWREYLRSNPTAEDRPEVLYRIGRLCMDAEQYGDAAAALVEADQLTDDDKLKSKIGPRLVECLRRLGRYGEVGRELSRQVEVDADDTSQGEVLATFAGESFTEADLDRMIERTIDRVLAMQPDGPRRPTREQLLQQYSTGEARMRMLQEILQRELFSRRARELQFDRKDEFVRTREFLEEELLSGRFLASELEQIQPTDVDVESYYASHQANYRQPESAEVILLPVEDDQTAEVLQEIASADDFRRVAAESNGEDKLNPSRIAGGRPHPLLGDTTAIFELGPGEWTKTPIAGTDGAVLVLVESKTPATTPPLEQIRFRVESDYQARKRQELTQRLFEDLTSRYDVQVLATPASRGEQANDNEPAANPNATEPETD